MKKIDTGTLTRTILIVLALINQGLVIAGKEILPFTDDQVTQVISFVFTASTALWAWWKNNNFTTSAKEAQEYAKALKQAKKTQGIVPTPSVGSKDDDVILG
ncbi:phage holin [uncultured Streptococcus sp.]|uniref:phage holin n=1 Tax=uncultured Streptococcus sp. TaxID=83427 RepID=UPI0028D70915|nr:phage holin [uncultured Streptococcus sp.]